MRDSRIGVDARVISHENATFINSKIGSLTSKLIYPEQNLVDCIWNEKPKTSFEMVYIYPMEFAGSPLFLFRIFRLPTDVILATGESARSKLQRLMGWIRRQPASIHSYSKQASEAVGTLVTSLPCIGKC